jgi:hypothetical protein
LSDVAATNADHESHEWHPKTKFIADILKGKGKTDLVGKGHKLYYKTLIADILKENDKTKLISEGHKQYHMTKEVGGFMPAFMEDKENPCMAIVEAAAVCLISEGQSEDQNHTVSAASLITDVVTNNGWMTFFLYMLLMHPSLMSMLALTFPLACAFLNSITIDLDGLQPCLLGKGVGYPLEGVGIHTEAV